MPVGDNGSPRHRWPDRRAGWPPSGRTATDRRRRPRRQRRRVVARVEAIDLALGVVGIVEPDRERGTDAADSTAGRVDREQPVTQGGQRRNSGHGEAEMIESTPLEHRRAEAVDRRVVAGQLEDVESMTSPGGQHGLTSVAGSGTEHQRRLEADDVLGERAVAVQIPCHDSDVADPARDARWVAIRPAIHTKNAFTRAEQFVPVRSRGRPEVRRSAAPASRGQAARTPRR